MPTADAVCATAAEVGRTSSPGHTDNLWELRCAAGRLQVGPWGRTYEHSQHVWPLDPQRHARETTRV